MHCVYLLNRNTLQCSAVPRINICRRAVNCRALACWAHLSKWKPFHGQPRVFFTGRAEYFVNCHQKYFVKCSGATPHIVTTWATRRPSFVIIIPTTTIAFIITSNKLCQIQIALPSPYLRSWDKGLVLSDSLTLVKYLNQKEIHSVQIHSSWIG